MDALVEAGHAGFAPVRACWVCGGSALAPVHTAVFELSEYARQDPELARYSGATVSLVRCGRCGFGQPEALPALERFFDRMYDQRWSAEWAEAEFTDGTKDLIFRTVLRDLAERVPPPRRTLLDVGAHVGRLLHLAAAAGWRAEGVEVNERTAGYAARATGLPVHRCGLRELEAGGRCYGAVTLVDVLEHIPEPIGALRAAAALLEPGGWMAVKVPEGAAQLRKERVRGRLRRGYRPTVADNLVHVSHFTAGSLRLALEGAGLTEVRIGPAPPVLPPRGAPRLRRALAEALPRALYHAARLLPGGERSPLTLHLLAYARKPVE